MRPIQNSVLSIAGFDPSGGAGVLADIKTFEQLGVYGCGISTCITYQNDIEFSGVKWLTHSEIASQFKPLIQRFTFNYSKIGLVENIEMLEFILSMLKNYKPEIKIVWDPVLKTSSGFSIHNSLFAGQIDGIVNDLYLITPNAFEAEILNIDTLKPKCNILVTGGQEYNKSVDILFYKHLIVNLVGEKLEGYEKHGSGCVLSAAITAYLALGNDLEISCQKAKEYTFQFLQSDPGLLGHHHHIKIKDHALASY